MQSFFILLFLLLYKFLLMIIYAPNFLIERREETIYKKYINIFHLFIEKCYNIILYIDKCNRIFFNLSVKIEKKIFKRNFKDEVYKSK
jgi:hypothetical protein